MIPMPPFRLVTAPADARVTSVRDVGARVAEGEVVAVLEAPRGRMALAAPVGGRIGGVLAGSDRSVSTGEGIVWIER